MNNKIALLGSVSRFAAAESLEEYANVLLQGKELIKKRQLSLEPDRFFKQGTYIGGFLNNIGMFDHDYFHLTLDEAKEIDPLSRAVLMEIPKLANCFGGIESISGKKVGVFIGARAANYSDKVGEYKKYSVSSLGQNFISAYSSHIFNFKGPSIVVDTACSSSLVAVHLAMQSLKNMECDIAIAGGVELFIDSKPFDLLLAAGAISPSGKCSPFSEDADGIILGEGIGLVALKRFEEALGNKDNIDAVLLGSAVNNDGATMGITTPSHEMQVDVIKNAVLQAKISPGDVGYVEAHATGTQIGDPIELLALSSVYGICKRCLVGSVKGNIGHLLSASGIASFIKVVEIFKNDTIFKTINCENVNKRFHFEKSKLEIAKENTKWPYEKDKKRIAAVSAFGFGGTNAHIIISDFEKTNKSETHKINYSLKLCWPDLYNRDKTYLFSVNNTDEAILSHTINFDPILPGVTYISIIASNEDTPFTLKNVVFLNQLKAESKKSRDVFLRESNKEIQIESAVNGEDRIIHFSCKIEKNGYPSADYDINVEDFKKNYDKRVPFDELYDYASSVGIRHDGFFRNSGEAFIKDKRVLLEVLNTYSSRDFYFDYNISPALLDGATFAFVALYFDEFKKINSSFIPLSIEEVKVYGKDSGSFIYAIIDNDQNVINKDSEIYKHNVIILNDKREIIAEFVGIMGKKIKFDKGSISHATAKNITLQPPSSEELNFISEIIHEVTGINLSNFGYDTRFLDIGIESSDLIAIVRRMEEKLNTILYPVLLFEYETPNKLAEYISSLIKDNAIINLQKENKEEININADEIAIIGMFGEFGPYSDHRKFWKAISSEEEAIKTIPSERLNLWNCLDLSDFRELKGTWIKDIDKFDCEAYEILPKDAELIDPQERKLLDVVRRTIEESGYSAKGISKSAKGKVGVFACAMFGHYELWGNYKNCNNEKLLPNSFLSGLANRISYFMDWTGPSISVDTMCSSALTALHLAKESLRRNEVNVAVVGAVNLVSHPQKYIWLKENSFLSADGTCPSFGRHEDGCDGYIPGEGVGSIILKRLQDAKRDNDNILGIIKGSAVNHGGRAPGYTVPNIKSQESVIQAALEDANISFEDVSYIEGHGTGTSLGDPIEIKAISNVFLHKKSPLHVGSVKANTGHLESASGMASLGKVLLQMHHKELVPTVIKRINDNIELGKNIQLQRTTEYWKGDLLTAGISSFGAGGSNAHVILQNFPQSNDMDFYNNRNYLLCFSANSINDLKDYISDVRDFISEKSGFLHSLSYVLLTQRTHCKYRICKMVFSEKEAKDFLDSLYRSFSDKNWFLNLTDCSAVVFGKQKINAELQEISHQLINFFEKNMYETNALERFQELYLKGYKLPDDIYLQGIKKISLPSCPYVYSANKHWYVEEIENTHFFKLVNRKSASFLSGIAPSKIQLFSSVELKLNCLRLNDIFYENPIINKIEDFCLVIKCKDNEEKAFSFVRSHIEKFNSLGYPVTLTVVSDSIAIFSLLSSFCNENINFTLIEVDGINNECVSILIDKIFNCFFEKRLIRYDGKGFFDYEFIKSKFINKIQSQEKSHYLILGGLGRIGYAFSKYISENTDASISIITLSELDEKRREKITLLKKADCFVANTLNELSIAESIEAAIIKNGNITHIIYASGNINSEIFDKVRGLKNVLDSTENSVPVTCISSYSSVFGFEQMPQYAFANGIMDDLVVKHDRKVISFLFPYISGTKTNFNVDEYHKWYEINYGIEVFSDKNIHDCARFVLNNTQDNGIYLCAAGEENKVLKSISKFFERKKISREKSLDQENSNNLNAIHRIKEIIRKTVGLSDSYYENYSWSELGFSSVDLRNFATAVKNEFDMDFKVNNLFEYTTPSVLANYIKSSTNQIEKFSSTTISDSKEDDPIMIVEADCLLPKSNGLDNYYDNLKSNKNLFSEIPPNRWKSDTTVVSGFVDISAFDSDFFDYIPDEIKYTDPQQRIFLGLCCRLLQKMGMTSNRIKNLNIGVFVGAQFNDYYQIIRDVKTSSPFKTIGNALNFVANRVSHYFDFHGPSEVLDTACSSGMSAVYHAYKSILFGECDMAIAGAVSLMFDKQIFEDATNLGVISEKGVCNVFDESADGYVRSEGAGVIALMKRSTAIKLKLTPLVKLSGIRMNHSGKSASLTSPQLSAQVNLLTSIYRTFNINPEEIGYVEAHGTGTHLGDSVEIEALIRSFENIVGKSQMAQSKNTCFVSSVKSRIGHTEPTSGIAGIITAILAIKNGLIFGNHRLKNLNKDIDLKYNFFNIPKENVPWSNSKKIASVSSFGFGGTNLHCILEGVQDE